MEAARKTLVDAAKGAAPRSGSRTARAIRRRRLSRDGAPDRGRCARPGRRRTPVRSSNRKLARAQSTKRHAFFTSSTLGCPTSNISRSIPASPLGGTLVKVDTTGVEGSARRQAKCRRGTHGGHRRSPHAVAGTAREGQEDDARHRVASSAEDVRDDHIRRRLSADGADCRQQAPVGDVRPREPRHRRRSVSSRSIHRAPARPTSPSSPASFP